MKTEPLQLLDNREANGSEPMNSYYLKLIEKFGLPVFLVVILLWNQFSLQNWFIAELSRRNDEQKEQTRLLQEIKNELQKK